MYKNWLVSGQKAFFDVYLLLVFGRIVIILCDNSLKDHQKGVGYCAVRAVCETSHRSGLRHRDPGDPFTGISDPHDHDQA